MSADTPWGKAACLPEIARGNDLWFPPDNIGSGHWSHREETDRITTARAICHTCPVRAACENLGKNQHPGSVWGGRTAEEIDNDTPACADEPGTYKGWNRHRRARQEPCQPCKDAHEKRLAEGRERSRKAGREGGAKTAAQRPKAACGTPSGYSRHTRLRETVCDECRDARRMYLRALKQQRAS